MINTIAWHEECLKNWTRTVNEREERMRQEQLRIDADLRAVAFYRRQIDQAKALGKQKFDSDKFMKKSRPS